MFAMFSTSKYLYIFSIIIYEYSKQFSKLDLGWIRKSYLIEESLLLNLAIDFNATALQGWLLPLRNVRRK